MIDWWSVGSRWRAARATAEHGETERLIGAFARAEGVARSTTRRCEAALGFAERAEAAGLLSDARHLEAVPLKAVALLQRISRYGMAEVGPVLELLSSDAPPGQARLERIEAEIRNRQGPAALSGSNAHAIRLTRVAFKQAAIAAIGRWYPAPAASIAKPPPGSCLDPFAGDAVIRRDEDGHYIDVRMLPATAETRVRPRIAEEFLRGVAAARVFDAVLFVTQARSDAIGMAALIRRCGKCGVGVLFLDPAGVGLLPLEKPTRIGEPDMQGRYAAALDAIFAPTAE